MYKTIKYGGLEYKVCSDGIIYGQRGKPLQQRLNADGYLMVTLGRSHERRCIRVHRIIAAAFVTNDRPSIKTEVNHIDFNRTNNDYRNLSWTSHRENVLYSVNAGRYNKGQHSGELNGRSVLSERDVKNIKHLLCKNIPATQIARVYGVGNSTIYNIKSGNTWNHIQ